MSVGRPAAFEAAKILEIIRVQGNYVAWGCFSIFLIHHPPIQPFDRETAKRTQILQCVSSALGFSVETGVAGPVRATRIPLISEHAW
jgi:hypothetical protein